MAKAKVTLKNAAKLKSKLKRIPSALEVDMRDEMVTAAIIVQKEARSLIRKPKSGKLENSKKLGKQWQRSAPGEPPAYALGKLHNTLDVKKSHKKFKPGAKVFSPQGFARLLEYGTRKMKPRPFLRPALRVKEQLIARSIVLRANAALRSQAKK